MPNDATQASWKPALWTRGDWNAFSGYGSNLLVNVLVLTGLLQFALGMPAEMVFGRVLPAVGVMLFLSTAYYSWLARSLAKQTGRDDVCALPSGPGVGHMFIVTLVVMLPIKIQTGDVVKAWEAGMVWIFVQSIVLMLGSFFGEWIRKVTPRAALLGALAGISITYISIKPLSAMYLTPIIGLLCFAVILVSWFGGYKLFRGSPAALIIICLGAFIAWTSNLFGLNFGGLSASGLAASVTHFGFQVPIPAVGHVFSGFEYIGVILITALPFGVYDVIEAIDNVESASTAGDDYSTKRVLMADGVISMIGCLLGNPYMLVVYIGHPGWKAMGGRIGYCLASGTMILVLTFLGIVPLLLAAIPIVAIYPILLFIGMLIGSQAFRETPSRHAPAIVLGILPHLAHWGHELVVNTLAATGETEIGPALIEKLAGKGVMIEGLEVIGDGSVLTGIVLTAVAVFVIDGKLKNAAVFTLLGAFFSFVGLMHSPQLGFAQAPLLTLAYVLTAAMFLGLDRYGSRDTATSASGNAFESLEKVES